MVLHGDILKVLLMPDLKFVIILQIRVDQLKGWKNFLEYKLSGLKSYLHMVYHMVYHIYIWYIYPFFQD